MAYFKNYSGIYL